MNATGQHISEGRDQQQRVRVMRLARCIKHMLRTLDEPFDLDGLAAIACLSRYHFVRQFRGLTGESPERFQMRLRLQRAAWSLAHSTDGLTDIAASAGYAGADSFGRAFQRVYGVSPSTFRRLGSDPWLDSSHWGYWRPDHSHLQTQGDAPMIELRPMPQMIFAAVRTVGPYNTVGPSFDRILGWATSNGLMTANTRVLGLSWDDPGMVAPDQLRYDAAITIDRRVETPKDIHISALPALTWAMATHKGSFAHMGETFMKLGQELGQRPDLIQVPLCGMEIYLSGPDTPEADLVTELGMPVVHVA
jgi:AraC family transcriptional regulator